MKTYDERP
jgi:hypothetical protein